jgi:uroporphyrinogen-III synthase
MAISNSLSGRRIGITEHRFAAEMARLVERYLGEAISCPLLEECALENLPELDRFVEEVIDPGIDMVIFFTGVGFRFLHEQAVARGRGEAFLEGLRRSRLVARGPKPQAALAKAGLRPDLAPVVPTSDGLVDLLRSEDLAGRRVGVQLYGEPNTRFCGALEALGAIVRTVEVYNYRAASDEARVAAFIDQIVRSELDAVTFTSAPQVASLFDHGRRLGASAALVEAFRGPVIVVAIGEVTRRALEAREVQARVVPIVPKMGPMVAALAAHFGNRSR